MVTRPMRSNNRLFRTAIGFALAASMTLPYAAAAQGTAGTADRADAAGFCKALAAMSAKVEERLAGGTLSIAAKRDGAQARLETLKKTHDDKLKDLRAKEDESRGKRVGELDDLADTDAERQALQDFQTDVAAAVAARRAATDAANDAFRDGLKALLAARKSAIDAATGTFAAAARAALAKAKKDCASGISPATVRQALLDAMKTAREMLQSDLQAVEKIGPQVKTLIETRRAAHEKAMDDFHAALEQAKSGLKTAFGAA